MSSNQTNVFKSWWGKIRKSQAYNDVVSLMIAVGAGLVFGFIILLVSNPSDAIGGFLTVLRGDSREEARESAISSIMQHRFF